MLRTAVEPFDKETQEEEEAWKEFCGWLQEQEALGIPPGELHIMFNWERTTITQSFDFPGFPSFEYLEALPPKMFESFSPSAKRLVTIMRRLRSQTAQDNMGKSAPLKVESEGAPQGWEEEEWAAARECREWFAGIGNCADNVGYGDPVLADDGVFLRQQQAVNGQGNVNSDHSNPDPANDGVFQRQLQARKEQGNVDSGFNNPVLVDDGVFPRQQQAVNGQGNVNSDHSNPDPANDGVFQRQMHARKEQGNVDSGFNNPVLADDGVFLRQQQAVNGQGNVNSGHSNPDPANDGVFQRQLRAVTAIRACVEDTQTLPESKSELTLKKQRVAKLNKLKKLLKAKQAEVKALQANRAALLKAMQDDLVVVDSNAKGVQRTWSEVVERGALGSNKRNMGATWAQQGLPLIAVEGTADMAKASMVNTRIDLQKIHSHQKKGHAIAVQPNGPDAKGRARSDSSEKGVYNKASAKAARVKAEVEWVMPKPREKLHMIPTVDTTLAMAARVRAAVDWVMPKGQTKRPDRRVMRPDKRDRLQPGKVARVKADVEWVMPKPRQKIDVIPITDTCIAPAMAARVRAAVDWVMTGAKRPDRRDRLPDRRDRLQPGHNFHPVTPAHSTAANRRGQAKHALQEAVKVIECMVAKIETPRNIRRKGAPGYVEVEVSDKDAEKEAKVWKTTLFKCIQTLRKVKGYGHTEQRGTIPAFLVPRYNKN